MQQAIIILLIFVFGFSTIGMYIAAAGTPGGQPRQQASDVKSEQNRQQNSDLPLYLREGEPNIQGTRDATDASEAAVDIGADHFAPTVLRVSRGTTVVWHNRGDASRSVTSDRSSPRSGLESGTLDSGETYRYTFEAPGVYNYYSQSSPASMRGVVRVVR